MIKSGDMATGGFPPSGSWKSITDMDRHSPAIAGADLFDNLQPFYWSSTTSVYDPRYAWAL